MFRCSITIIIWDKDCKQARQKISLLSRVTVKFRRSGVPIRSLEAEANFKVMIPKSKRSSIMMYQIRVSTNTEYYNSTKHKAWIVKAEFSSSNSNFIQSELLSLLRHGMRPRKIGEFWIFLNSDTQSKYLPKFDYS